MKTNSDAPGAHDAPDIPGVQGEPDLQGTLLYHEKLSSRRTTALFLTLAILFLLLLSWRVSRAGQDILFYVFCAFFTFFLFYVFNYRSLHIQLSNQALRLKFGLFSWTVPLENIAACRLDHVPPFLRYGGAGIHFMFVDKRYRASFNFLEYPRVVIAFKRKAGPVQDLSFSTRQPGEVVRLLEEARGEEPALVKLKELGKPDAAMNTAECFSFGHSMNFKFSAASSG